MAHILKHKLCNFLKIQQMFTIMYLKKMKSQIVCEICIRKKMQHIYIYIWECYVQN